MVVEGKDERVCSIHMTRHAPAHLASSGWLGLGMHWYILTQVTGLDKECTGTFSPW